MQTTHFSGGIGVAQNHHTSWNGLCLFGNLRVLRRWKAADLSSTYPLEPADVLFNPSFPWGSFNQKYVRDEKSTHQLSPQ